MAEDPTTFLPEDDTEDLDPDEELDALEGDSAADPLIEDADAVDLVLAEVPPPPLGRAWAFDFQTGSFLLNQAHGPLETRGLATLRGWIEKCLMTARGAHPIHPPEYGVEGLTDVIGEAASPGVAAGLEEGIRDALLFHPRITDVRDFDAYLGTVEDGDEDALYLSFTVVTEDDERLDFEALTLTPTLGA
jgi:hypothetical protein